jgi:NADPH:quinone reductase-like Zn-dependent oxidoreductase
MKAIRYAAFGAPDVLHYEDAPRPVPAAGEVLIAVEAAGVNPIDWKMRKGRGAGAPPAPVTPGFDVAGTIVGLGSGVTGFKKGDRVFALLDAPGGYAEFAAIAATRVAKSPKNLDAVHAAAIPTAAVTAWRALFDEGGLKRGQTVLIHGGAGGVGHFAVQLAKHAGARVIATASAENQEFLKALGTGVTVDYKTQRFEDFAHDVDLVLDTVGGETLARSYGVVREGGTIVTIVTRLDAAQMTQHKLRMPTEGEGSNHLDEIAQLVGDGAVKVEISNTFPLADAAKAHEQSETKHARGKIVLVVRNP